jgi:hypothetical protein
MKPLGRPTLNKPKGYQMPRVSPRPANPDREYMNKVVDLKDLTGNFLFRGTRRQCLQFSKWRARCG